MSNIEFVQLIICFISFGLSFVCVCVCVYIYIYTNTYVCFILLKDVDVSSHSHTINGLKKYTEYSFRVVAYNKHGPGVSTQDVAVRTFSDGEFSSLEQNTELGGPGSTVTRLWALIPRFGSHTSSGSVTSVKSLYMSEHVSLHVKFR